MNLKHTPVLNGTNGSLPSDTPEPIAVIGVGCRFPGRVNSPEEYLALLRQGRDAVTEVPADRWSARMFYDPEPGRTGKSWSRWGGFIEGIDRFDAAFFGISRREAERMDPQQRVLLELAWEALEDAGLPLEQVSGAPVAVYVGLSSWDYSLLQVNFADRTTIDTYNNTGSALSIAANRISFCFNFKGPSAAIDTACSSSLVGVHLACHSLWRHEATLALAGGVNVLMMPDGFIGFSRLGMLSPDGRCKAFDVGANGFVRGEGGGLVVLKRLSKAQADGDRIYAVIRATGVNQDGRTHSMVVPSQQSQEDLVRQTCKLAGISPRQVGYVEAHGTGTSVGDPIEARALGAVLAQGRAENEPCLIGSVKTNLGHLEPAAGIAGLIKAILCVRHRQVPASLHLTQPNPEIDFRGLRLRVPQKLEPWPSAGPAVAAVNSFGFGGTNAHAIVEEPPGRASHHTTNGDAVAPASGRGGFWLLPLSARSPEALKEQAARWADFTAKTRADESLEDLVYSAALRRTHHDCRLAVVAHDKTELAAQLRAYAAGEAVPGVASGNAPSQQPKWVFVFSGQGPQWWGMGRQLFAEEPVFRAAVESCDRLLREYTHWSLVEELRKDESASRMHETMIGQPALFAVQFGLAELWRSWGIVPAAVIGHSLGELAAACAAGVLDLSDAIQIVFHRSRCIELACAFGRMLAVGLSPAQAEAEIADCRDRVSIAACNGPTSVTLSGDAAALEALAASLEQRKIFCRFLKVSHAFHSPMLDVVQDEMLASGQGIQPRPARIPMLSTVTEDWVVGPELNADYWWRNFREPVRFSQGVDRLLKEGYTAFLEISPHPVLSGSVLECAGQQKVSVQVVPSLRRQEDERRTLLRALGTLYTLGAPIDWVHAGSGVRHGRFVTLPLTAWQRESYWHEGEASRLSRLGLHVHPLLGNRLPAAMPTWENCLDLTIMPYLTDHRVQNQAVYPTTAYLEMGLAAARLELKPGQVVLEEVKLSKAMFLSSERSVTVQSVFHPAERTLEILSRPLGAEGQWTQHVSMRLRSAPEDQGTVPTPALDNARQRCRTELPRQECYRIFSTIGLNYGPRFQAIHRYWHHEGEALAEIVLPEQLRESVELGGGEYSFHPVLLDACLQTVLGVVPGVIRTVGDGAAPEAYLPVELAEVRVYARTAGRRGRVWCHAQLVEQTQGGIVANLQVYSDADVLLWEGRGLRCQAVGAMGNRDALGDMLYQYRWRLALRPNAGLARSPLPGPELLDQWVSPFRDQLFGQPGLAEWHARFMSRSNRLCGAYVSRALQDLGADWQPGDHFGTEDLGRRLGVAAQHFRQLDRMLGWLAEDGQLRRADNGWEVIQTAAETPEPSQLWSQILFQQSAFFAEVLLLRRCGQELPRILRGDLNVLTLLFPEGSTTTAEHLYSDSPSFRMHNLVFREALIALTASLPEGRPLRILEIGAGTGGLTTHLLPWLPADRTEYVFTDLSQHFLNKAAEKFQAYPFVRYQLLDVEKPPTEQGLTPHAFDLVVAFQTMHATADLRQSLGHVRQLLAPGGLTILLELMRPLRFVDLLFGFTEGWWRLRDSDVRPDHPLMSFPRWKALLTEMGFEEVVDLSSREPGELLAAVLTARAPFEDDKVTRWQGDKVTEGECNPVTLSPCHPVTLSPCHRSWLLLADRGGVGDRLAAVLRARGDHCTLVRAGSNYVRRSADDFEVGLGRKEHLAEVVRQLLPEGGESAFHLVHLWNLDATPPDLLTVEGLSADQLLGCVSLMHLVQAWEEAGGTEARLSLITRNAWTVTRREGAVGVSQSLATGLYRTLVNEFSRLSCKAVDLSPADSPEEFQQLCEELVQPDEEDEVALRGEARYVHRYEPVSLAQSAAQAGARSPQVIDKPQGAFRLSLDSGGTLDGLALRTLERRPPDAHEVEIEVYAAGLNFSDVLKALGLYPGLPAGPVPLGLECSGVVTAVGGQVANLCVGDRVAALGGFCLASHMNVPAAFVARMPDDMFFEEAATIPVAFLTAYHALHYHGRMCAGETVLIHSATGGVGLAAVQLARLAGARILATAGTSEKRDLLRTLGVEHVMDSRTLAFADEVLKATGGRGVDLVLNSLAGDAIAKGLTCLADYGRFLEIGKRDIYANTRVGLLPFRKNLSFIAIDLDRAIRERPWPTAEQFQQVFKEFQAGRLSPLPFRVFPVGEAGTAFRYMAQGKHLGKVVLTVAGRQPRPVPSIEGRPICRADGAYLITGGLGGFGLVTARWLVEQGARNLILVGRSGAATPEAQSAVEELRRAAPDGAPVNLLAARCDVSQSRDLAALLDQAAASMPPLRGVVHAAMVLSDMALVNLDQAQLERVVVPKAHGAWNLHLQTQRLPLDFFVCYSSMATVVGNTGQANYSAGNSFLNALASHRRALGLPALTIDWGYLAGVGYVSKNEMIGKRLNSCGFDSFTADEALTMLGRLLRQGTERTSVIRAHWNRFSLPGATGRVPLRYAGLIDRAADAADAGDDSSTLVRILDEPEQEGRREVLLEVLRERVARVLGTTAAQINPDKPLAVLGMDSLMAVELRNWVEKELRVSVPIMELMQASSLAGLADVLLARLQAAHAETAAPVKPQPAAAPDAQPAVSANGADRRELEPAPASEDGLKTLELLDALPELSAEEMDALLSTMLVEKETDNAE
jgi:acyl transferase domain-containing protein/NADPH:quinone reductase-like Zn-dependent oxidoreductase/SAM-dependent methyltransferase/acyl carrier protein